MKHRMGFTLIELLIVVAIIAILAAIAVPNFLEAQTRAKVSRVRADLRTVVTALESYRVDYNVYPPHRGPTLLPGDLNGYGNARAFGFRTIPLMLSTPVAYITTTALLDPFKFGAVDPSGYRYESGDPTDIALVYHNIYQYAIIEMAPGFTPDDFTEDYGHWRIFSLGPDKLYNTVSNSGTNWGNPNWGWYYDPSNGTISTGFIVRTQLDTEGHRLAKPN